MDQKLSVFSEDSAKLIKSVVEEYLRRNRSKYHTHWQEENRDTIFAPEVYIAEVPEGGIPALTRTTVGETGTGSETTCRYIPGSATCNIYKIQVSYTAETGTGTGYNEVIEIVDAEFSRTVYNVSRTAITGPSAATTGTATATGTSTTSCTKLFVVVKRDKYGHWLAEQSGSGSATGIIGFRVLSAAPYEYSDLPECGQSLKVTAEVTEVSCGTTDVSIGDYVTIYDPRHCKFDLPIEVLIGALGTAVKMTNTMTTDYGDIEPGCAEYEELSVLTCRWVVTDLSCCEECYACD